MDACTASGSAAKARREAERIREQAQQEKAKVQEEINLLTQRKIQFEASFRALIDTHLKLMEGDKT